MTLHLSLCHGTGAVLDALDLEGEEFQELLRGGY